MVVFIVHVGCHPIGRGFARGGEKSNYYHYRIIICPIIVLFIHINQSINMPLVHHIRFKPIQCHYCTCLCFLCLFPRSTASPHSDNDFFLFDNSILHNSVILCFNRNGFLSLVRLDRLWDYLLVGNPHIIIHRV